MQTTCDFSLRYMSIFFSRAQFEKLSRPSIKEVSHLVPGLTERQKKIIDGLAESEGSFILKKRSPSHMIWYSQK